MNADEGPMLRTESMIRALQRIANISIVSLSIGSYDFNDHLLSSCVRKLVT